MALHLQQHNRQQLTEGDCWLMALNKERLWLLAGPLVAAAGHLGTGGLACPRCSASHGQQVSCTTTEQQQQAKRGGSPRHACCRAAWGAQPHPH